MTNTEAIVMGVIVSLFVIGLFTAFIVITVMDNKKVKKQTPAPETPMWTSETVEIKEWPRTTLKEYIDQRVEEAVRAQAQAAKTHSADADVQGAEAGAPSQSKTHSGNADLPPDPADNDHH